MIVPRKPVLLSERQMLLTMYLCLVLWC